MSPSDHRRYSISLVLLLFSEHRHSSDVGETANATYAPCADHQSVQICVQGTSPVSEEPATHITWCRDTARNARTEGFHQHRRRRTMLETVKMMVLFYGCSHVCAWLVSSRTLDIWVWQNLPGDKTVLQINQQSPTDGCNGQFENCYLVTITDMLHRS